MSQPHSIHINDIQFNSIYLKAIIIIPNPQNNIDYILYIFQHKPKSKSPSTIHINNMSQPNIIHIHDIRLNPRTLKAIIIIPKPQHNMDYILYILQHKPTLQSIVKSKSPSPIHINNNPHPHIIHIHDIKFNSRALKAIAIIPKPQHNIYSIIYLPV